MEKMMERVGGYTGFKRLLAMVLCLSMVFSLCPIPGQVHAEGICDHHQAHTPDCGYVAAVEGQPCGHTHTEACYTLQTVCLHVHGDCGYVAAMEEVSCACQPNENGETVHTEGCGYAPAVAGVDCGHVCSEETGCVTKTENCAHQHDESCGYREAAEGKPCTFVCQECIRISQAAARVQAFLDAVAALNPDSPDANALLDAACEALDALEDEDRELPEVQEAMAALDEALGIVPEEAAPYIDIPEIPTVPQVYPSATQIRLKAVGFPSTTKAKVQEKQKFLNFDVTSASATEIILTVSYMGNSSGDIYLPKASELWEYDTPNEILGVSWRMASGKKEGDQVSYAYGLNVAEYDFKGTPVTYKLVYDLDGGVGDIQTASKTTDERECKFEVTTQKPTQAGYNFLGWAETRGASTPSTKTSYTVRRSEGTTKTLYAVWKRLVTVTYTDGVDGVTLFADQSHTVESGSNTPDFQGELTRSGYVFDCWKSSDYFGGWIDQQEKVYNDVTYVAFWKEDRNNNGIADESETRYTITYQDGANGQYFSTQTFTNQLSGLKTPAFTNTVNRPGYVISGWTPSLTTTITGNTTYTAIWSKDDNNNGVADEREPKYTVTYVDGLNGSIFQPEVHSSILTGLPTPNFTQAGTVKRSGYVLYGWSPSWSSTVTKNVTYTAIWEPDINGNNRADKDETKYTVTYKDGVSGAAFSQEQYTNQLIDMPTPSFKGETKRKGYVFDGWDPAVKETIRGNATYTAKWAIDENGNGVADRDDPRYTILYTDGVKNVEVFRDQVTTTCLPGIPTPAFSGTPTRSGYVFGGWAPEVETTVTDTVTYTAVWKRDANGNGVADDEEIWFTGDPGKTYDGTPVSMENRFGFNGDRTSVVEYKKKDAADSAYTTDAPVNAGNYTVRVTLEATETQVRAVNTLDFTISPITVTVSGITAENKIYDGNTEARLDIKNVNLAGILECDSLTVTATGIFANKDVGTDKNVSITNITLEGDSAGNYVLDQRGSQTTATADITRREVTIQGTAVKDGKVYDGNTNGDIISNGSLKGVVDGDDLSILPGIASYQDVNVGSGKTVTFSGFALSGAAAGNYILKDQPASTTADITARQVTIQGTMVKSTKVYDGTTSVKITKNGSLVGGLTGEDLSFTPGQASYLDANVGTGKTVTFSGFELAGTAKDNYTLTGQPADVTADITQKDLAVDVKVSDKQYDGRNTATFDGAPALVGLVPGDETKVRLSNGVPTFERVGVEENIPIRFTAFSIDGETAGNYKLAQPSNITAGIFNRYTAAAGQDYAVNSNNWQNSDFVVTAGNGFTLSETNTDAGTWSNTLKVTQEGTGTLTFYVRDIATGTISTAVTEGYKIDRTKPTGAILFGEADITDRGGGRACYENGNISVTLTGSDNLSDVANLAYCKSDKLLSTDKMGEIENWQSGSQVTIPAAQEESFYFYAKVTDHAGNTAYFRSSQTIFDLTAPVISGVTDGTVSYTTQTATVSDDHLETLTLNGQPVTSPVKLPGDIDQEYTLIAADKAGNSTSVTITMRPLSTLVQPVEDVTVQNVTREDQQALQEAKAALQALPETATEAEKQKAEESLDQIEKALKTLENAAKVEKQIKGLPTSVQPDETEKEAEIKQARAAYEALSDDEKRLVDTEKLTKLEAELRDYRFLTGNGSTWNQESEKELTFKANGALSKFSEVRLDGKTIDKANYSSASGSTIITLTPAYLQSLSLGVHKIQIYYTDGNTEEASFEVKHSPNHLVVEENSDLAGQTEVWVDGVAYPVESKEQQLVTLPGSGEYLTTYTYRNGNAALSHDNYPTGMKVYRIDRTQDGAVLTPIPELDNLLRYSGSSIRVTGKRGIRMITSLDENVKAALTGNGLAGFTLDEYGTVLCKASELNGSSLTLENGKHNFAYKKGAADPVFARTGGLIQYTNVLVGFSQEECGDDILMRPYIILRDAQGQAVTLYGGTVSRSIRYIAWQNRDTYQPGTDAYNYVHELMGPDASAEG